MLTRRENNATGYSITIGFLVPKPSVQQNKWCDFLGHEIFLFIDCGGTALL